ncbi:MAG: 5-amino-6-(D-ribitylamino)uracil--L-tyrosine 4-hydroxyphenyl transferase CofH [Candidatus Hodarchaeota archaeon]
MLTTDIRSQSIVDSVVSEQGLSKELALRLLKLQNPKDIFQLVEAADMVRQKQVGSIVTYVRNRNINFTNICVNNCLFCSYHVSSNAPDAYLLSLERIHEKVLEALENNCTELCIQGGISNSVTYEYYLGILETIRNLDTKIHIHAFSPEEILHASRDSELEIEEVLQHFKEAGLDSMPGTAAEILHDPVREQICPRKLKTAQWVKIIQAAHKTGIPTSSTIMYGHVETVEDIFRHLQCIKSIQEKTRGFTEFVLLPFIHPNTILYKKYGSRPGSSALEDLKIHAVSRLHLGNLVKNIQASTVKLGLKFAQLMLLAGCNDLGGTLYEENISRSAGARNSEFFSVKQLTETIQGIGRIPRERNTTYTDIKTPNMRD